MPETQIRMRNLLEVIAKLELEIECQRQVLAGVEKAEPYSMFQRLDRDKDGLITPMEILKFLRECNAHLYHEADCYYLVKFFDADQDGCLSYADFLQIILPCDNDLLRAVATQKPNEKYVKEPE